MAYSESSTAAANRVRLLVGDISTSTSGELLHDGAYTFFVAQTPNIWMAACLAANTLAARVGSLASSTSSVESKKVGDLALAYGLSAKNVTGLAQALRGLCDQFKLMSSIQTSGAPYAGGISISDKRSAEANADRVRPVFTREQFDDPSVQEPDAANQIDRST
ncbi:MAG: hypothetical protein L0Z49_12760 [Actinobacteria bacterium]|nr:hypothetical protein [Actinomycetota bacterium]